jgi:hypothetical protein
MLAQALVWPMVIEMADVLIKNSVGMSRMVNQHLVGAFSADAANEPLRVTTEEVDTARGVLYDEQDVQPVKQQGVDAKEVGGEDAVGLGGQELSPGGAAAARGRVDAGSLEDQPHGAGCRLVAEGPASSPWSLR